MRDKVLLLTMFVAAALLAACGPLSLAQGEPELQFDIAMEVNSEQEFHVSLGVHNAGRGTFDGDNSFNAEMEVRGIPSGDLRASAHVVPMQALEPGETAWPMDWHGRLQAGTYELTWGAPGYGQTSETFTIVEEDGRLYFRGDPLATPEPEPTPAEEQDAPVDEAVSDLQGRLGVDEDEIAVATVESVEFPDASLGVPEPGQSYAQMVVPGYIIRLRVDDELYEYHAADERLVLVPREPESAGEVSQGPAAYRKVTVPEVGVAFDVPADWQRLAPEFAWAPAVESDLRLGVNGTQLEPPMEPEAVLLPNHARIVASDAVNLGWADGRRFTLEVYGPAAERADEKAPIESVQIHVLVVVVRGGERLGVDFYASAPSADALVELEPALTKMLETASWSDQPATDIPGVDEARLTDWQVFEDQTHGFRLRIPQEWTYKEMRTEGPGVPQDWPLERSVAFFPQAWADRFEEKSGPPDPGAPVAVPALSVEVYVGSMKQFRRANLEPTRSEKLDIDGLEVVREIQAVGEGRQLVRYVLEDPGERDVRVVLVDALTGFTDRLEERRGVAELLSHVVATFEFLD